MSKRYLIVGGVAGGASVAVRIRRLDESLKLLCLSVDLTFPFQTVDFRFI